MLLETGAFSLVMCGGGRYGDKLLLEESYRSLARWLVVDTRPLRSVAQTPPPSCHTLAQHTINDRKEELTRQPTPKPHKQIDQKNNDQTQQHHQLHILPPHPPLQRPTPHPKIPRVVPKPPRLVHQHGHVLPPLQHPLDVLGHDLAHALDLALRRAQRVRLPRLRGALLDHQALEVAIEGRAAVGRQGRKVCFLGGEGGEEGFLEVAQEAEGDALAEVALGDDEEGEAAGGTGRVVAVVEVGGGFCGDVDEEFGLVDCFVGAGCVGEFGEDEGDERGGVGGGGGGVLG